MMNDLGNGIGRDRLCVFCVWEIFDGPQAGYVPERARGYWASADNRYATGTAEHTPIQLPRYDVYWYATRITTPRYDGYGDLKSLLFRLAFFAAILFWRNLDTASVHIRSGAYHTVAQTNYSHRW